MIDGCVQCEVYSSLNGSWKRLGRFDVWPMVNPFCTCVADQVCLDGKLYWLIGDADAATKPSWIMMVDIHDMFHKIDLPKKANDSFLIKFRGQLCFIDWSESYISIWGYEEEKKSWQLLGMPQFSDWSEVCNFDSAVANRDEILFVYYKKSLLRHEIVYDVGLKMWKEFSIPEADKEKRMLVFPFVETLFPCGQFLEDCRDYARKKVTLVAQCLNFSTVTPRSTDVVFKRIGFAIQKGLTAQLVARLPSTTFSDRID
ncbi:putative F-box protein [Tanacetum coccineum]